MSDTVKPCADCGTVEMMHWADCAPSKRNGYVLVSPDFFKSIEVARRPFEQIAELTVYGLEGDDARLRDSMKRIYELATHHRWRSSQPSTPSSQQQRT